MVNRLSWSGMFQTNGTRNQTSALEPPCYRLPMVETKNKHYMHAWTKYCMCYHSQWRPLAAHSERCPCHKSLSGRFGRIDPDRRPLTHIPHSVFRIHLWTFRFFFEGVNHHSQCKDDTHKSYTRACRDDPCCSPFSLTFQRAQAVKNVFSSFSALGSAFALCARLLCLG